MAAPTFAVRRGDVRDAVVLTLTGALDAFAAPDLDRAMGEALAAANPGHALVVDLCALEFIAAGGVRALLRAADAADRVHVPLRVVVGEDQYVRGVIDRVDLDGRIPLGGPPAP
ncbi:STAS domain-containing protein [Dactylosporangium sp. McL0621]|uniref:STAS domain-containing protein n=1 Tax=Dactylosporangium sp. McL0621 TaxID=3415678 RepID=UPI003CF44F68